jgi:endonuclease YncB( thermonuclease family)
VVGVSDGDTITVRDSTKTQHKIRLAGIDAPEQGQPFGSRSKEHLSQLVFNKTVSVAWHKRDRYGRLVGIVLVDGQDVNLEQVGAGLAWWYRQYANEQTPTDRQAYEAAENAARDRKSGLWRDTEPMPPWEWRRERSRNP